MNLYKKNEPCYYHSDLSTSASLSLSLNPSEDLQGDTNSTDAQEILRVVTPLGRHACNEEDCHQKRVHKLCYPPLRKA